MDIDDCDRAKRKLAQVGYYRLTGFSYICRAFEQDESGNFIFPSPTSRIPKRSENFLPGTTFNKVFELYLFDKRLRLFMIDAIERIEIFVRSIIAHEMGRVSPSAYQSSEYILPKFVHNAMWERWVAKHSGCLDGSKLECIRWHKDADKEIPFWVAIEAWDFGLMSHYFSMLKRNYQMKICCRIDSGITPATMENWLREINTLRNRCAHHARIWNSVNSQLSIPSAGPLSEINWGEKGKYRLFGLIVIMWHLIKCLGRNSSWLTDIATVIDSLPDLPACNKKVMGFPSRELPAIEQLMIRI
ncbi:Abi family protein [Desulfovibrio falkowii]|uniref:Abi family protein n=1 Tax=Desulfovibrio falkowii TaxID=3136602 RepID=UPI0038B3D87E